MHVRTVLENEQGHVLCAFERKALVRAGTLSDRPPGTAVTELPTAALSTLEHLPPPLRQSRTYAPRSTLPGLADDFSVGQVFVHDAGKTIGESEHMQLTLLLRNSHPLHFDELYCKANSFQKTRIVYGGSLKPDNAAALFACANIDGGLIGGASLDVSSFSAIARAAQAAVRN